MPIPPISRRRVLRGAAALATSSVAAPFIRTRPIRDRLKLAAIGVANRGAANVDGVLSQDVAVMCDVDSRMLERGMAQVEAAGQKRPKTYVDWRELLDQEKDLAGVVISTPDHLHAPIARAALRRKIAVYCEKPLSRTVEEAQQLQDLAKSSGVATQMGTQIHATNNYRRVVEAIRAGAIGDVHTVHVVCRKSWSNGKFSEPKPAPAYLDWDLWLGPTPERPYCDGVHPLNWRRFWAFGTGTVGDMACHWVDLVHWALDLKTPVAIEVEGPAVDPVGTPEWMHVKWSHAAEGARKAVDVHWWDGGSAPELAPPGDSHVFLGTKGRIVSNYSSMKVELDGADATWEAPAPSIANSPGHYVEWLDAIEKGTPSSPLCSFDYSGPLTQTVLLATVAYRAGGQARWDAGAGSFDVDPKLLGSEDRPGWDV